jgi:hypothetical protein
MKRLVIALALTGVMAAQNKPSPIIIIDGEPNVSIVGLQHSPPQSVDAAAELELLKAQVAALQAQVAVLSAPPKHPKLKKMLVIVDHLGSVASILSVIGIERK